MRHAQGFAAKMFDRLRALSGCNVQGDNHLTARREGLRQSRARTSVVRSKPAVCLQPCTQRSSTLRYREPCAEGSDEAVRLKGSCKSCFELRSAGPAEAHGTPTAQALAGAAGVARGAARLVAARGAVWSVWRQAVCAWCLVLYINCYASNRCQHIAPALQTSCRYGRRSQPLQSENACKRTACAPADQWTCCDTTRPQFEASVTRTPAPLPASQQLFATRRALAGFGRLPCARPPPLPLAAISP